MTLYLTVMRDVVCSTWHSNSRYSPSVGMTSYYMCLVWWQSACHRVTPTHDFSHRSDTHGARLPSVASAQVGMYSEKKDVERSTSLRHCVASQRRKRVSQAGLGMMGTRVRMALREKVQNRKRWPQRKCDCTTQMFTEGKTRRGVRRSWGQR